MKRLTFLYSVLMILIGVQTLEAKTYYLTISSYEPDFFEQDNDVYLIMHTEDNAVTLRLDIIVEEGQQFFTNGKTYTWDDMMHPFCYAFIGAEFKEYKFADASFTWRLDELGLEHFAGSAVDSLGNTYNFHYDVLPYNPTGDTIDVTFPNTMKLEHSEEWYFTGSNDEYYLLLTLINEGSSPVGHYTNENIVMDYSYIDKTLGDGEYAFINFHHAEVDITEATDDTLKIEALIAGLDTNIYRFHAFYIAPKPLVKNSITATNLYINTDYLYGMVGAFQVEASDDSHYVKFAFSPMSEDLSVYDTYTISNTSANIGYVQDYMAGEEEISEIYEGTITISKTDKGAVVSGTVLCYDNTEYTINLSYDVPEKTSDRELTIDGLAIQVSKQGAWHISGYNAEQTAFVSMVFNGFGIEGTYSIVETSPAYSYIVTDITWDEGDVDSYTYYDLKAVNLTATLNEADSVVTVTGTVIAQNSNDPDDAPQFTVQWSSKAKTEDIANVNSYAVATKRLENGMIIVEKNGVKYTITGTIIH